MAIKTNELQQVASALGTDSVLLDTGSAGTARLSLANLAKYLTEQDNAVKTALSNKAALSAQQTVEQTNVEHEYPTLAASELQAYFDSLPKLVTKIIDISVTGELHSAVNVKNFYGPGFIQIYGGNGFQMKNILRFEACSILLSVHSVEFQENSGHTGSNGLLQIHACNHVDIYKCSFIGRGSESSAAAVEIRDGSRASIQKIQISGVQYAIEAFGTSAAGFRHPSDQDSSTFENNINGAFVQEGGMVLLAPGIPDTLGGVSNTKLGGLIVKSDGTLL